MKRMKTIVALVIAFSMLVPTVCSAKTLETTRVENMNVALSKPVYAAATEKGGMLTNGVFSEYFDPSHCSYSAGNVELPTGDVVKGAEQYHEDWYIIDLGEAYKLTEVKLYARGDGGFNENWMQHFKILVSNSILFPEGETVDLGGIEDDPSEMGVTSASTPFVAELDGQTAYRYIKLQKTDWSYHGYSELEAYSDVEIVEPYGNATFKEVSKNKPAEVNYGSYYDGETVGNWSPDKVVDGQFLSWQGWIMDGVSDRPEAPYNLLVDLEENLPIAKIEMFGRPEVTAEAYRSNWKVYGFTEEEGKPDISGELSGGTELISVTSPFPQITDTENPDADDGLSMVLDEFVPYRYLVFSKIVNELGCLSEIRAYIMMPEVLEAEMLNTSKVNLKLSEEVSEETLEEGIIVYINGKKITPSFSVDNLIVNIDLGKEYFNATIDIDITEKLLSKNGMGFLETDYVLYTPSALTIDTSFINSLSGTGGKIESLSDALAKGEVSTKIDVENNTAEEKADVLVITALYNENNFIVASSEKRVTVNGLSSETIVCGLAIPQEVTAQNVSNYKLRTYVWKDYGLLKPWISRVTLGE